MATNHGGFESILDDPDYPGRAPGSGDEPLDPGYPRRRTREDPSDWRRWFQLGFQLSEHPVEAAEAYGRALRLRPDNGLVHRELAFSMLRGGAPRARAIQHLRAAVALRPADRPAWNMLGILAAKAGRVDSALHAWRKVAALRPDEETFWSIGDCLHAKGRHRAAAVALEEAVRLKPNHLPALLLL